MGSVGEADSREGRWTLLLASTKRVVIVAAMNYRDTDEKNRITYFLHLYIDLKFILNSNYKYID
jgi:hypothetical protein